ncbi:MAG TPA: tetratricopeptide repeat protein, partial [Candidatus Angelobacter sp.]|nr:tetratricopeptide repeat protein [Candidatus Angelobacter sp.]
MLRAQRYQEAADLYRRALQLKPRLPVARYGLAIALSYLGNNQEALREAENALREGLKGADKKACQDWVRRLREAFQKDAEHQKRVELATLAFDDGNRMYNLKRYAEAEAAFRKAFAYDPDAPTAGNLGLALNGERRFREAEEFYRKAISLDPAYTNSYSHLGALLLNQDR